MKKLAFAVAALAIAGTAFAGAPESKPAEKAAAASAASAAGSPSVAAKVKGEGEYRFADEIKWDMPYGPQGPAFATVMGDAKKKNSPTQMFMKFPAGFDSGWHTHDGEYTAVVVKGVITHQVQGGVEHKLGQGSLWTQPAKVNHVNKCLAEGGECIIYGNQPKGFSFTAKTAEGKDVPAPAKDAKATGGSH
jgi:quercetin dioxygenase-like cupin family protein